MPMEIKRWISLFLDGVKKVSIEALLIHFYRIKTWEFLHIFLAGLFQAEADYMHYVADLLAESNSNKIPSAPTVSGFGYWCGAYLNLPIYRPCELRLAI